MNIFVEAQPLVYFEHVNKYEIVGWVERKCAGIKASEVRSRINNISCIFQ